MSGTREPNGPGASLHRPVLLRETMEWLALQPGQTVVDGTVGGGGHGRRILEHIGPGGRLIGLDRDPTMLEKARTVLSAGNCDLVQASYADLREVLRPRGIKTVDRLLLDLGLSSDQLADEDRGFAFQATGPLDLRFDPSQGEPAWQLIERCSEDELTEIFRQYGEERFSRPIARELADRRPVRTARDLVEAVDRALPPKIRREARKQPATRVFQALRIAVNDELRQLETALREGFPDCLGSGGRIVVLTFHSLEDRLVKTAFRDQDRWHNLTPRPITAGATEKKVNPRSRSAKLRAAERR